MTRISPRFLAIAWLLAFAASAGAAQPDAAPQASVTIVTLGDSITKGARQGVTAEETFAHLIQGELAKKGVAVRSINIGIGGERTDQALARLADVIGHKPRLVTIMYGTNDSYVDRGKSDSRLTLDEYRTNLRRIVDQLLLADIEPVLMTEPRWAADATNGLGENPNIRLEPFMAACRQLARDCEVPLVDHFAHWTEAENGGQTLREWTTDGCHPNPRGHKEMARTMLPVLVESLRAGAKRVGTRPSAGYRWSNVTDRAAYAPRDGAGALTFRNRMWLLGGWNPSDKQHFPRVCNNEVWSSSDGAQWRLEKPNTFLDAAFDPSSDWEGRHTAGYAVYRDKMWIVGGDANQSHYQNDVWNSADGRTWKRVASEVPWSPRALHYTLAFDDKLWVIGGQTMPAFAGGKETFYRDLWTTTDGANWTRVAPQEPCWSPRGMIGGSAVLGGRMWILGGGTYDTPTTPKRNFYNDVWSSADGVDWTRHTAHAPWHPRQYHDVATFDDKLWVLEGYHADGGNRNDVWYSSDGENWHELPDTPWKPRHAASVFVSGDALWMVAGNNMQRDVWKLVREPVGQTD